MPLERSINLVTLERCIKLVLLEWSIKLVTIKLVLLEWSIKLVTMERSTNLGPLERSIKLVTLELSRDGSRRRGGGNDTPPVELTLSSSQKVTVMRECGSHRCSYLSDLGSPDIGRGRRK